MIPRLHLPALLVIAGIVASARAQDEAADGGEAAPAIRPGVPVKLDISRRRLKNFLTDEIALTPHLDSDGNARDLHGAFVIGAPSARYAVIWDPRSCRLAGVLDLQAPPPPAETTAEDSSEGSKPDAEAGKSEEAPTEAGSPYRLLASGPPPFTSASGAFGLPEYFGFRVDGGRPVFLYTHGALVIEECLWLEDGGSVLEIRYSVREPASDLSLTFPEDWLPHIETGEASWKGSVLTVPKESGAEFGLAIVFDGEDGEEEDE